MLDLPADIDGFYWAKTTRGSQLGVKRKGASDIQFLGFREKVLLATSFSPSMLLKDAVVAGKVRQQSLLKCEYLHFQDVDGVRQALHGVAHDIEVGSAWSQISWVIDIWPNFGE